MTTLQSSIRRLRSQAAASLARTNLAVEYLRATCQHATSVQCRGIVLCQQCGSSWGAEDDSRPQLTVTVAPAVFRSAEAEAPDYVDLCSVRLEDHT